MFMSFSCTMLRDRLILSIWCCDSYWYISYLTQICIYRYLPCLLFDIWYWYLPCYTYYLISDTGTCHARLITWYPTPVHSILYLALDIWHRYLSCYTDTWYNNIWYLTCYHPVLVHLTWYCDTCIILHIHDYYFYRDLAWLLYCY